MITTLEEVNTGTKNSYKKKANKNPVKVPS